jgi:aprataxin
MTPRKRARDEGTKKKRVKTEEEEEAAAPDSPWRDALGVYLAQPASFPSSRVVEHSRDWVVINDMYPKSAVHMLLLSRDAARNRLHPFDALADEAFLRAVRVQVEHVRGLVAKELERLFGCHSAPPKQQQQQQQQQQKQRAEKGKGRGYAAVKDGDEDEDEKESGEKSGQGAKEDEEEQEQEKEEEEEGDQEEETVRGRDWAAEIVSGVHARPSMSHFHVHVLSRDRVSASMKKRAHYNSFATPFLVPLDAFPLPPDDERRRAGARTYLQRDLVCWRCGRNFKNQFARLKAHLAEEFVVWKRE